MNNRVIKILMQRDGLTEAEALAEYRAGIDAFNECIECGDVMGAMEIPTDYWGLEPDYLDDIMFAL